MGESKKASDNNQTLRNVRVLIDILSQCTVYIAFAAFIILGVTHKTAEYIPYAFLVAVPVVVTYFIRKYVHPLFLFTIIHVAFVIGAVLLGRTEAEMTAYFECACSVYPFIWNKTCKCKKNRIYEYFQI